MRGLYLWILSLGLLKLCSGDDLSCRVDEVARGVLYQVPTFKGTGCIYSWRNQTDHVLAHQGGMLEEHVLERTNHTLLLKKCLDVVLYARSCISEQGPHREICNASCSWISTAIPNAPELPQTNWTLIIYIIIAVVLMAAVLILCIVFRDRICRCPHCFTSLIPEAAKRRRNMDIVIPLSKIESNINEK